MKYDQSTNSFTANCSKTDASSNNNNDLLTCKDSKTCIQSSISKCDKPINTCFGKLYCGDCPNIGIPEGPYEGECIDAKITDIYTLSAKCEKNNGDSNYTSLPNLDSQECQEAIQTFNINNCDGSLKCGSC